MISRMMSWPASSCSSAFSTPSFVQWGGKGIAEEIDLHEAPVGIRLRSEQPVRFNLALPGEAKRLVYPVQAGAILGIVLRVFAVGVEDQLAYPVLVVGLPQDDRRPRR